MLSRSAAVLKLSKSSAELIATSPLSTITSRIQPVASVTPAACASTASSSHSEEPRSSVLSHFKDFWQYFGPSSKAKEPISADSKVEGTNVSLQDSTSHLIHSTPSSSSMSNAERITDAESESSRGVFGLVQKLPSVTSTGLLHLLAELGSHLHSHKAVASFQRAVTNAELSNACTHLESLQANTGGQFSAKMSLNILKAMALLRYNPKNSMVHKLVEAVCEDITALEINGLVDFLQALAMLNVKPSKNVFDTIGNVAMELIQDSLKRNLKEPIEVVNLVEAFAALKHVHEEFLLAAGEYLRERVKGLSEESLAMAMQGFAKLNYRHNLFLDATVQECLDRQPKSFSPSQLTAIVHSVAILRAEDVLSEILVDVAVLSASKRIDQFSPEELANLIWSYTQLFRYHGDVKLLDSLAKNLFSKMHQLDGAPDQLLNLAEAVTASDLGSCPEETSRILSSVEALACKDVKSMSLQTMTKMLLVFCKSRHYSEQFVSAGLSQLMGKDHNLGPGDIARTLLSCGVLVHRPDNLFLENWISVLQDRKSELTPSQICHVIWSLAIFNNLNPATFEAMCKQLNESTSTGLQVADIKRLLHAEMLLEVECKAKGDTSPKIPEPLRGSIIRAWRERMYFNRSISLFQQEVSLLLMKLSIPYEQEQLVEQGDFRVDFHILGGANRKIALECDGPRRFSSNVPSRPLGDTIATRRILQGRDWSFLSISKHEWQQLGCPGAREVHVRSLLQEVL